MLCSVGRSLISVSGSPEPMKEIKECQSHVTFLCLFVYKQLLIKSNYIISRDWGYKAKTQIMRIKLNCSGLPSMIV